MSLATRRLFEETIELGSMALSDESVVTAARSAGVQVAAVDGVALELALGVELLDEPELLLPHAASSATMAIASRAPTDHSVRRRVDLRGAL